MRRNDIEIGGEYTDKWGQRVLVRLPDEWIQHLPYRAFLNRKRGEVLVAHAFRNDSRPMFWEPKVWCTRDIKMTLAEYKAQQEEGKRAAEARKAANQARYEEHKVIVEKANDVLGWEAFGVDHWAYGGNVHLRAGNAAKLARWFAEGDVFRIWREDQ